jgi:hypothetical protein
VFYLLNSLLKQRNKAYTTTLAIINKMIQKSITSFTDNINQKLKNPFFGTFIVIWFIRNWEFLYSLFYFDSKLTLDNRIEKINLFFINYGFIEILITIGYSFLVLLVTYILLNLSRLIVNFFEKTITPEVYKITDKSSIILKSEYIKVIKDMERLESKVETERELRLKIQSENEKLESRIKELISPTKPNSVNDTKKNVENKSVLSKIELVTNKLKTEKKSELFEQAASDILNSYSITKAQNHIKEFTTLGLIKPGKFVGSGKYSFTLTQLGELVHENMIMEKLK